MTEIRKCTCKHSYQDTKYGKNNRVFNIKPSKPGTFESRCTVCGKEHKS
jgi:hypothetical protein